MRTVPPIFRTLLVATLMLGMAADARSDEPDPWAEDLDVALEEARTSGKPLLVYVFDDH